MVQGVQIVVQGVSGVKGTVQGVYRVQWAHIMMKECKASSNWCKELATGCRIYCKAWYKKWKAQWNGVRYVRHGERVQGVICIVKGLQDMMRGSKTWSKGCKVWCRWCKDFQSEFMNFWKFFMSYFGYIFWTNKDFFKPFWCSCKRQHREVIVSKAKSVFLSCGDIGKKLPFQGGWPYHVTYPMMHLMLPTPNGQTDSCENITFL